MKKEKENDIHIPHHNRTRRTESTLTGEIMSNLILYSHFSLLVVQRGNLK